MKIKLKMGKDEDKSEESDGETNSAEETTEEKAEPEEDTKKEPTKESLKAQEKKEDENQKKNTDELRKVIKIGSKEGEEEKQETSEKKEETPKQEELAEVNSEQNPRESLEQKRAILQSIKDFDFQIKKNQEGINSINQKMESLSKDLDDLVSLYEIVSEQMNPFVGLSKVTKKRIDALENFTKEIEDLKDRTGELEYFAERSGVKLRDLGEIKKEKVKTIDTEALLGDNEEEKTEESENIEELEKTEDDENAEKLVELGKAKKEVDIETAEQKSETTQEEVEQQSTFSEEPVQPDIPQKLQTQFTDDNYQITEQQTYQSNFGYNSWENISDNDLNMIIERTLSGSLPDRKIDMIIDEFIESLKG